MPGLFDPLTIRGVTLPNRIVVSPMCEYSSTDGHATDWHFVHLGSRAVGGAALVLTEATAVTAEGRISPQDLGIWSDAHIEALARIVSFIDAEGAVAGIQLAHAGRKASTFAPGRGTGAAPESAGGWSRVLAPSAIPFTDGYPLPLEMTAADIAEVIDGFAAATRRARTAGFRVIEIHAAHGYLLHEFLSPLSNHRTDKWGGSFDNRARLLREVIGAVRREWPEQLPLFVRMSVTEWVEGGWDVDDSITLASTLAADGVDLVDCSSGGNAAQAKIPMGPGYQTPFAERLRREAKIPTGAVGMITEAHQAEHVIRTGQADLVVMARELLRDPYWPMRAAMELGQTIGWPRQYLRAGPHGAVARERNLTAT